MNLRKAVLTGATGLMLASGLTTAASAQPRYRRVRYHDSAQWRAEQAVRQAYLDNLQREPDAAGLREYPDAMMRRGWSIGEVRRSLLNSDEYADRFGRRDYRYYRYR